MKGILILAIQWFAQLLYILLVIRVILSWIQLSRRNVIVDLIYTLTEPILGSIRNILRKSPLGGGGMMIDFSPLIAFFLIELVKNILIGLISRL